MCVGMLAMFSVTSAAAAEGNYDSGEFDGSKGWVVAFTVNFPKEGAQTETAFSGIYSDGKMVVGSRIKYNPETSKFLFEFELNEAIMDSTKNGWSNRAIDKWVDDIPVDWCVGEVNLFITHEAGATNGITITAFNAGELIYQANINDDATDEVNWTYKDNTPVVIGDTFDNAKMQVKWNGNGDVKVSRGHVETGWSKVADKYTETSVGEETVTGGKYEQLFYTPYCKSACLWYWIHGNGDFRIGGRVNVWNNNVDISVQILGKNWAQEYKITEKTKGINLFKLIVESDGEKGVIKVLEGTEVVAEVKLDDSTTALFTDANKELTGISEFGDFWGTQLKVAVKWETNPTTAERSMGVVTINEQPAATTTATATTAPAATPTPTPTTGDAMFAVVALAVVAVAGTAIVSKKRR